MRIEDWEKFQYEYALRRVEELLPLVDDNTPDDSLESMELAIMSTCIIDYEKKYYPMGKPTLGITRALSV